MKVEQPSMNTEQVYHGFINYSTWNVEQWLQSQPAMFESACAFAQSAEVVTYRGFINCMGLQDGRTPDGIGWLSNELDFDRLDDMIKSL